MAYAEGSNTTPSKKPKTLAGEYQQMDSKKSSLHNRCEEYALWTLPYVFPKQGIKDSENQGPLDSTGARAVNHLSNKLIMTLFQPYSPFFRLNVSSDIVSQLSEDAEKDEGAKETLAEIDKALAQAERDAMRELDYSRYRTEATTVAKSLIVTGNSLMYLPTKGRVQSYGLRDYCVQRDLSGNVVKLMTRDKKALSTFSKSIQDQIKAGAKNKQKYTNENCDVVLYTKVELKHDGKYHMTQAADDVMLDSRATWTVEECPYIVLTWNLIRGEDYGRGLVEDYAGSFHALHVLNQALLDMVAIAADIKFLVDPSSVLNVVELNNSESGSYHTGKEGDISVPQLNKQVDMAFIAEAIATYRQQIAMAFLLNSSVTRDAERVTAEEIRYVAQELELSHGGIYSRFAEEWQLKTAVIILKRININLKLGKDKQAIEPQIITGLDSLSRAGDLDNLRLFLADLQMLNEIPEDIRAGIDIGQFIQYVGIRRGVDYQKFAKTQAQMQQELQAAQQMQSQQMQQQVAGAVATEAGKAAVKQ